MIYPTVSVCIPTWRGGDFLEAAIRSVLTQNFTDFELIIIDDCSPDDTAERVLKYIGDRRVKFLRNVTNLGPQGNWNRCLAEASGKYVKLLPHDDLIAADCLSRQVEALETHPKIVVAFSSRNIVGTENKTYFVKRTPWRTGVVSAREVMRRCIRAGTNLLGEPGAVLFRRAAADQAGPFSHDAKYVLDLDYWSRLLAFGDAWCDRQPLASFRISNESWSIALGRKQAAEYMSFVNKISKQAHVEATPYDITIGHISARLNNLARRIIYATVLR